MVTFPNRVSDATAEFLLIFFLLGVVMVMGAKLLVQFVKEKYFPHLCHPNGHVASPTFSGDLEEASGMAIPVQEKRKQRLMMLFNDLERLETSTIVAVILHNIPEGMITFVATLANPHVGVGLALAIAVHNLPEGYSIALPVYLTKTGSKWKGILTAGLVGGVSEPLGALLGYAFISFTSVGGFAFGTLFACTAGIMTYVVIAAALPLAFMLDCHHTTTPMAFFAGIAVMSLSFVIALA